VQGKFVRGRGSNSEIHVACPVIDRLGRGGNKESFLPKFSTVFTVTRRKPLVGKHHGWRRTPSRVGGKIRLDYHCYSNMVI
jgi:hypothetical protein